MTTPAAHPPTLDSMAAALTSLRQTVADVQPVVDQTLRRIAQQLGRIGDYVRERLNSEVHVSGLEARYHVRAALDPAYATPAALDVLVADLLAGREGAERLSGLLTRATRIRLAVAAMRGWAEHR